MQKTDAQLAYELQAAKLKQRIRTEEIEIEVVERKKQIEIEEQEIARKEKELTATVKLPAEAESYRLETIAEGKRTQVGWCKKHLTANQINYLKKLIMNIYYVYVCLLQLRKSKYFIIKKI